MKHVKPLSKAQSSPLDILTTIVSVLSALLPILSLIKGSDV